MYDIDHHVGNTISILLELPQFYIVCSVGLDYRHLTCLVNFTLSK